MSKLQWFTDMLITLGESPKKAMAQTESLVELLPDQWFISSNRAWQVTAYIMQVNKTMTADEQSLLIEHALYGRVTTCVVTECISQPYKQEARRQREAERRQRAHRCKGSGRAWRRVMRMKTAEIPGTNLVRDTWFHATKGARSTVRLGVAGGTDIARDKIKVKGGSLQDMLLELYNG